MRCLHCNQDGVSQSVTNCPKCGVHLPSLLRDVLPSGTLLRAGAYRIDYALGRGGFGITYRAVHLALDQCVAIKEFYPHAEAIRDITSGRLSVPVTERDVFQRSLQRFIREGRILVQLNQPGIVRVQDLFEERDTAYLVMELVEGPTLRAFLDNQPGRRLGPDRVNAVIGQLVEALGTVHSAGVFHLDIKPDNILLTPGGRVVLVDFGAARQQFASRSTQAFTVEYAAPEVLAGTDVGPESDIFELGMVTYELLTGQRPPSALNRFVGDEWKPRGLDEPWEALVKTALQMRKDARPESVRQWWKNCWNGLPVSQPSSAQAHQVPIPPPSEKPIVNEANRELKAPQIPVPPRPTKGNRPKPGNGFVIRKDERSGIKVPREVAKSNPLVKLLPFLTRDAKFVALALVAIAVGVASIVFLRTLTNSTSGIFDFRATPANINSLKIGKEKSVSTQTSTFGTGDKIYASAEISNAPRKVTAKWRLDFDDVKGHPAGPVPGGEASVELPGSGTANYTCTPPPSGWPKGKYKLDVMMLNENGEQKDQKSASFSVD